MPERYEKRASVIVEQKNNNNTPHFQEAVVEGTLSKGFQLKLF